MNDGDFKKLIAVFERDMILAGVKSRVLGRTTEVSARDCKLSRKSFGEMMGAEINTDTVVVVDYYGYQKKSRGFKALSSREGNEDQKLFTAKLIHFASIRIQDLVIIAKQANLVLLFPSIKNEILIRRGFIRRKNS